MSKILAGDLSFVLLILLCGNVSAQIYTDGLEPGPCREVEELKDFNYQRFAGRWFEIARTINSGKRADCIEFGFPKMVNNDFWLSRYYVRNNKKYNITENRSFNTKTGIGYLVGNFKNQIMYTDYDGYFVYYSCVESSGSHYDACGIFGRERKLTPEQREKATEVLTKNQCSTDNLEEIRQSNCPDYYGNASKSDGRRLKPK